jgi:Fuc2NAc and GlcNAc transferase
MQNIVQLAYSPLQIALLFLAAIASFFGTYSYRRLALRHSVIADVNFRSLHARVVPRGGGVAFGCVFSIAILCMWKFGAVPTWLMLSFGLGGAAAALVGFIDDVYEIAATTKLLAQIGLALWSFAIFFELLYAPYFSNFGVASQMALAVVCLFTSVWFINMYNFIDGADGMAIGGALYICIAAIIVLAIGGGDQNLIFVFALLAATSLGFLPFNAPPASVFMGDAGSIFLGYCLGSLLLATAIQGQISIWTWIAILGYFIGDTTTTGVYRLLFVKKWYSVHRSHAYQNLARILNNHSKVTYGVGLYHVLWALPLAIWSAIDPGAGPLAASLSLGPAVLWALRFGPRLSSD